MGLETCHESGISHGDIKLQNILLNSNFTIKLIDFGFSRKLKDGLISEITGSKYYNAPEMFLCATKGYDGVLADIFSLGVVLFVLVMGFYPFDKPNIMDNRYKLITKKDFANFWKKCEQKKNFLDNNITGVSPEFKDLFEKMICPKPEERITLNQIKKHKWLNDIIIIYGEYSDVKDKIEINKKTEQNNQFSPKKNKNKCLSHSLSFNKEEKKYPTKDNKIHDNISNHSDDTNQKKRNKKKSICLNLNEVNNKKFIINTKNSLLKEFEVKYINELSSRKMSIDKIMKEEEDEGD